MNPYVTIKIPTYSLCIAIGLLVCVYVAAYCRRNQYDYTNRFILVYGFITLSCMCVGSKVLYVLTRLPDLLENFTYRGLADEILFGGFVFYGGLFGGIVGVVVTAALLDTNRLKLMDYSAPLFALFHGFGRIGCFLGGCCYGVPWKYGVAMKDMPDISRFPIQLLESIFEFIMFAVLIRHDQGSYKDRNLMLTYVLAYSIMRFFAEFLRDDSIRGIWFWGLSTSQIISIISMIICLIMYGNNKKMVFVRRK